ncbi:MAG: hypothetical protein HQL20_02020 [Candidatus Omnitrophica bacterium]|nr:hypothetical protein [Candidatus Omnitrophota bacterium]
MQIKFIFLVIALLSLSSCAKLQYMDQGLTLLAYSNESDELAKEVAHRDAGFDRLAAGVRSGEAAAQVKTAEALERRFGPPVVRRALTGPAVPFGGEEWLYRYQVKKPSPRVYVTVLSGGAIQGFRYEE